MTTSGGFDRRSMLRSGAAAAAYALGASQLGLTALAQGAAIQPRGAAHHRFSLGTRDVLVLSDGHMVVPIDLLAGNVPRAEVKSFLATRSLGPDRVHFHINVALVRTGNDYVLIDAGAGGTWEQTAGKLADSLEVAGIKPEQIGKVVLTHAHPDHIWGLVDELDDSLEFPAGSIYCCGKRVRFLDLG